MYRDSGKFQKFVLFESTILEHESKQMKVEFIHRNPGDSTRENLGVSHPGPNPVLHARVTAQTLCSLRA